jgi:hypothetical protein
MAGANWIDVATGVFPPTCPGWVTIYPCGHSLTPDTPVWQERCRMVEEIAKAVLVAAAASV